MEVLKLIHFYSLISRTDECECKKKLITFSKNYPSRIIPDLISESLRPFQTKYFTKNAQ